jgi:hypothetical protein
MFRGITAWNARHGISIAVIGLGFQRVAFFNARFRESHPAAGLANDVSGCDSSMPFTPHLYERGQLKSRCFSSRVLLKLSSRSEQRNIQIPGRHRQFESPIAPSKSQTKTRCGSCLSFGPSALIDITLAGYFLRHHHHYCEFAIGCSWELHMTNFPCVFHLQDNLVKVTGIDVGCGSTASGLNEGTWERRARLAAL